MMLKPAMKGCILIGLALVAGCAQVPKEAGFGNVQQLVGQCVDYRLYWNQESTADQEVKQAIEELLKKDELSVDAAVQIALLNNSGLQATYEELGITQADVVEAGLLENPVLFGRARFPDRPPSSTNLELEIVQNFLNLLMLPARKKLAALQFEQGKLKVAAAVLNTATDVQTAYYTALGAEQINQKRREILQTARASYEAARSLHQAGNVSELSLAKERGRSEQAGVYLAQSEATVLDTREKLNRLMGLWGNQTNWKIPERLPDMPRDEIAFEHLESMAIENRLDLASARKEVELTARALGITVDWRWIGSTEVGVSTERDTDRQWVTGPSLAVEVPIFNQRQTDIARLQARLRQSQQRMAALAVDIRSQVRLLRNRLIMKRDLIEQYKQVILPLRAHIVELTLRDYNHMLVGVFDVLAAKQQEFDDYQSYIEALRDYWIARAELQQALGGRLPPGARPENMSQSPQPLDIPQTVFFLQTKDLPSEGTFEPVPIDTPSH